MPLKNLLNCKSVPMLFLIIVGTVYFITLAPTVVQIDSGELAAVQSLLGIAHPTGYPLFTLMGNLFLKIPLFHSKIRQLNFLALIWCVLGVVFFLLSTRLILASDKGQPSTEKDRFIHSNLPVITAGFFLAFSRTYWIQSTSIEVYSLHVFLLSTTIYFAFGCYFEATPSLRSWTALAFFLALSFSNHMTTILLVPSLIYLFLIKVGFNKSGCKMLGMCAIVFLMTVSAFYIYLPVRAAQNPVFNWGNPVNWANFVRHVTGRQYSVWLFKSSEVAWIHLDGFLKNFPSEFSWIGLILGFCGFVTSLTKSPRLFIFLAISFVSTVLYSINYDIHDLDSYFLPAYLIFAFWIAFGIKTILVYSKKKRILNKITPVLLFALIGFEAFPNLKKADVHNYFIFEDYSKQSLDTLPKNALLITYQWDYLVSPVYYFQQVEGFRIDVLVIDKELLRRSWYFHQLEINHPETIHKIRNETTAFLEALRPFETGGTFNPPLLDQLYFKLILRLIETHIATGSVFLGPELVLNELRRGEIGLPQGYQLIPDFYFYRVVSSDTPYVPLQNINMNIRFPKRNNKYVEGVKQLITDQLLSRIRYEIANGKMNTARQLEILSRTIF